MCLLELGGWLLLRILLRFVVFGGGGCGWVFIVDMVVKILCGRWMWEEDGKI